MSTETVLPAVFTIDAFSEIYCLSPKTVRMYCISGELRARKIGSKWLIPRAAAEDFFRRDHPSRTQIKGKRRARKGAED